MQCQNFINSVLAGAAPPHLPCTSVTKEQSSLSPSISKVGIQVSVISIFVLTHFTVTKPHEALHQGASLGLCETASTCLVICNKLLII